MSTMQIGPTRPDSAEREEKQQHQKISKIIVQVAQEQTLPQLSLCTHVSFLPFVLKHTGTAQSTEVG